MLPDTIGLGCWRPMNSAWNTKRDLTTRQLMSLSRVSIWHDGKMVRSLLEGAVTNVAERGEVLISLPFRAECDRLDNEAQAHALKLAPMHITNWEEAQ